MSQQLVSVIIPCHNGETYVEQAINSALEQTYPMVEVIVIDDGSTDGSLDIIRSFGQRLCWDAGPNRGAAAARNRGLELAQGEFVKFLDADDVLLPDSLSCQVFQAAQLVPDQKAIIYGDAVWVDAEGQLLPGYPHRLQRPNEDSIAAMLEHGPLTSCPLHRKNYLQAVGGFDPSISHGDESDLHLRLVLSGVEFVHFPGPVYHYRQHDTPKRLSNLAASHKGPLAKYEMLQRHATLIRAKTSRQLSPSVRNALAHAYWQHGRAILREGFEIEANQYFASARALDTRRCVVGNAPYPMFVRFLGPYWAEHTIAWLRSVARRVGMPSMNRRITTGEMRRHIL